MKVLCIFSLSRQSRAILAGSKFLRAKSKGPLVRVVRVDTLLNGPNLLLC